MKNHDPNPTNLDSETIRYLMVTQFMMDHLGIGFFLEEPDGSDLGFAVNLNDEFAYATSDAFAPRTWQQMEELDFMFSIYGYTGIVAFVCIHRNYGLSPNFPNWSKYKKRLVSTIINEVRKSHFSQLPDLYNRMSS